MVSDVHGIDKQKSPFSSADWKKVSSLVLQTASSCDSTDRILENVGANLAARKCGVKYSSLGVDVRGTYVFVNGRNCSTSL